MKKKMTTIDKLLCVVAGVVMAAVAIVLTIGVFWFFGALIAGIARHTGLV